MTGLHEHISPIWLYAFGNFYREVIDAVGTITYLLSVFVYIDSLQVSGYNDEEHDLHHCQLLAK